MTSCSGSLPIRSAGSGTDGLRLEADPPPVDRAPAAANGVPGVWTPDGVMGMAPANDATTAGARSRLAGGGAIAPGGVAGGVDAATNAAGRTG